MAADQINTRLNSLRSALRRMGMNVSKSEPQFGFFSVITLAGGTLVGGYLVLNVLGRPTEFHCTEALKPTRAQEILYGPTLAPFLYAEQLGRSLITAAKTDCQLIFTDSEPALDLHRIVSVPVAQVCHDSGRVSGGKGGTGVKTVELQLGGNRLRIPLDVSGSEPSIEDQWKSHIEDWDLLEPFRRIHDAIAETHKAA